MAPDPRQFPGIASRLVDYLGADGAGDHHLKLAACVIAIHATCISVEVPAEPGDGAPGGQLRQQPPPQRRVQVEVAVALVRIEQEGRHVGKDEEPARRRLVLLRQLLVQPHVHCLTEVPGVLIVLPQLAVEDQALDAMGPEGKVVVAELVRVSLDRARVRPVTNVMVPAEAEHGNVRVDEIHGLAEVLLLPPPQLLVRLAASLFWRPLVHEVAADDAEGRPKAVHLLGGAPRELQLPGPAEGPPHGLAARLEEGLHAQLRVGKLDKVKAATLLARLQAGEAPAGGAQEAAGRRRRHGIGRRCHGACAVPLGRRFGLGLHGRPRPARGR
mmetsp:Transcript_91617/g.259511  ORF Transcript_91617/g.259511 Transcript_91617/m.259511 type:complete len:328 (+) Transcript_91617:195-1178(+)